jgi:hypothetical protein
MIETLAGASAGMGAHEPKQLRGGAEIDLDVATNTVKIFSAVQVTLEHLTGDGFPI